MSSGQPSGEAVGRRGRRINFASAVPRAEGEVRLRGLHQAVRIYRDGYGIPHIDAVEEHDAWFAMGYASAQDRLWQMEWYRRRGTGRWSEIAGPGGLAADRLFRRFRLHEASQVDVRAMTERTRAMFEAYAAGVNAFVASGAPLPAEYELTDTGWEPWEAWHSVLVFKVRHVIMGKRLNKLLRWELLRRLGPGTYRLLEELAAPTALILPPGASAEVALDAALVEMREAAEDLGTLGVDEGGSNSWVVHGSRTTTGRPVICNDSHRPLDVPNVYWQVHVACRDFNVAGAAFPGFPAFPHFGHNGRISWNITHGQADYQDLWVEQFDAEDPTRYRTEHGWASAEVTEEEILVRGREPEPFRHVRTRNGDIVHGDPASGWAIAMRYTATDRPARQWECLRPMLTAHNVATLHETQRWWEEPVNALVSADTDGNIGFLYRGRIPRRSTARGRQFPVPGWEGEHGWTGDVPFDDLPRAINPREGFIGTANQRPIASDEPFIAHEFTTPGRAERIAEVLGGTRTFTPEEVAALQGDTVSVRARDWAEFLAEQRGMEGDAERARSMLARWDGDLHADSAQALLYACFRVEAMSAIFRPIVGDETWEWLFDGSNENGPVQASRWFFMLTCRLPGSSGTPDGRPWSEVLPGPLEAAWKRASEAAGSTNPEAWRWADVHRTGGTHPLSAVFPALQSRLDPPVVGMGGDSDTLQVSGYTPSPAATFRVTGLSVYRQVVDMARPEEASWIIPGGASGHPGSLHYADQLEAWRTHQRIPMHHRMADARAAAQATLTLLPG